VLDGDIRRSLLALQVWLETGATSRQKMVAPVYGPVTTVSIPADGGGDVKSVGKAAQLERTDYVTKLSESRSLDSGDEFVVVRKRKRRALPVLSSDEDSRSQGCIPASAVPVVEDSSSSRACEESAETVTAVSISERSAGPANYAAGMVTDQLPVALEDTLAPRVHRLDLAAIGGVESLPQRSRIKLQVR